MERLETISDLLQAAGCRNRVFDLGRQVAKIDNTQFLGFEQCQLPWSLPLRQHAWFAVAFWQPGQQAEPFVWFLHLPLDERGLLLPVARDHFLQQVLTVLGSAGLAGADEHQHQALAQSPFIRKPDPGRLALFHSLLRQHLNLPPSDHHALACQWLAQPARCDWQDIGLQGIADVLVRLSRAQQTALAERIHDLPPQALQRMLPLLEYRPVPAVLEAALLERLQQAQQTGDRATLLACLRALGQGTAEQTATTVAALLAEPLRLDVEFLATLAARLWPLLGQHPALGQDFLLALAEHPRGDELFPTLVRELLSLQPLRSALQQALRSPDLAPPVQRAVAALIARRKE